MMSFLDYGVKRQVVDTIEMYPNVEFQPRQMMCTRENGQKTSYFEKLLIKKS